MCQYLADQKPDAALAPAYGTKERYQLMEWLNFTEPDRTNAIVRVKSSISNRGR